MIVADTPPAWCAEYIGKPFALGSNGPDEWDCWGLVRAVYADRFGVTLPALDGAREMDASDQVALAIGDDSPWRAVAVDDAAEGDVLAFRGTRGSVHVGIATSPGWVLHAREGAVSGVDRWHRNPWRGRLVAVYRHERAKRRDLIVTSRPGAGAAFSAISQAFLIYRMPNMTVLRKLTPEPPRDPDELATGHRTSIVGEANLTRHYEPLMQVLGRHKVHLDLAATPYTTIAGGKLYGHYLFTCGKGPFDFEEPSIGDDPILKAGTAITYTGVQTADGPAFDNLDVEFRRGQAGDAAITLVSRNVTQTAIGENLGAGNARIRRTPRDALSAAVLVTFPAGLYWRRDSGKITEAVVRISVEYRDATAASDAPWTAAGNIVARAKRANAQHRSRDVTFPSAGQYDIRVKRKTATATDPGVVDTAQWAAIVTTRSGDPVLEENLGLVAIKVKLSNQLPDGLDDFNLIATPRVLDWNGATWAVAASLNPASAFRHVLQGAANLRPVTDAEIDLETLQAWHEDCDTEGLTYASVIGTTGRRNVFDVLQEVAAAGRASFTLIDGLFSVVRDTDLSGTPVQMLTPANSWDWRVEKQYREQIEGYRVGFVDPDRGWIETDRRVPADGFTLTTAEDYERIDFPGVTNAEQAWKLGRYHLALRAQRPTIYSVRLDWEYMNLHRGDHVKAQHDVMLVGTISGRILSTTVDGSGNVTAITVDEPCVMTGGGSYGVRIRTTSDSIYRAITTNAGAQVTLTLSTSIPAASAPVAGDLFSFGDATSETASYVVHEIRPGDDFGAEVLLVDGGTDILESFTATVPAYEPEADDGDITSPSTPAITTVGAYEPDSPDDDQAGMTVQFAGVMPNDNAATTSNGKRKKRRQRRRRRRRRGG